MNLVGFIDVYSAMAVDGWAVDLDHPHLPPRVELVVNGAPAGEFQHGQPRVDAIAAGYPGAISIRANALSALVDGENRIEARFVATGQFLLRGTGTIDHEASALAEWRMYFLDEALEPRPLLHAPSGTCIFWSAKAACTNVLQWYLSSLDLLKAAEFYSPSWLHRFRTVVVHSETYRKWVRDTDFRHTRGIKFVRDPYRRAISGYRHALVHGSEDAFISVALGRPVDHKSGYSFLDMLTYLSSIDITAVDPHYRSQVHPLESRLQTTVINTEGRPIAEALAEATRLTGIAPTADFPIWRSHWASPDLTAGDAAARNFTRADAERPWPDAPAFLNATTRALIEKIYAADFAAYGAWLDG